MKADDNKSTGKQPDLDKSNRPCPICGKPRSEFTIRSARSAAPMSTCIAG